MFFGSFYRNDVNVFFEWWVLEKIFKNVDFIYSNNLVVCLVSYVKGLRWRWGVVGWM